MNLPQYIKLNRQHRGYSNNIEILSSKLFEELGEFFHEHILSKIKGRPSPNFANEIADVVIVCYALDDINKHNGIIVDSNFSILIHTILGEVTKIANEWNIDVYQAVKNKFKESE